MCLDQILAAQEAALTDDAAHAQRALGLVRAARARLAAGDALSVDDISTLAREATMPLKSGQKELGQLLEPHVRGHFSKAEMDDTAHRSFDQEQIGHQWDSLVAEAKVLMAKGDPASPAALDLARRWKAQVEQFTRGDPGVTARVQAVWQDAMARPEGRARPAALSGHLRFCRQGPGGAGREGRLSPKASSRRARSTARRCGRPPPGRLGA